MNYSETCAKFEEIQTREMLDRQKHHGIVKYISLECSVSSPKSSSSPAIQGHHKEIQDI
jgi:hypothetical protein